MAFLDFIPIIGPIIKGVAGWVEHKQRLAEVKQEGAIRIAQARTESTLKMAEAGQMAEVTWDQQAQVNAQTSWKDEWFTIVLSIPMIMCFIPGLDVYVTKGFESMANTPVWYQGAVGVAIAASFGYRKLVDWMDRKDSQ